MTINEELNTALYKKMFAEQENFRDWLKSQPPEEILNHTYEYSVREDILMALECNDLDSAQARILLSSPSPLQDIFSEFEHRETDYMDVVRDCMESRAGELLRQQKERYQKIPVYPYPASYAREHDELEQYCSRSCGHYSPAVPDSAGQGNQITRTGLPGSGVSVAARFLSYPQELIFLKQFSNNGEMINHSFCCGFVTQ